MLGRFFQKKREIPEFSELQKSDLKDKYFYRVALWDWLDESMIHVTDNHAPRMITMDPWPQLIFLEADGQKTVYQFVIHMANKYGRNEVVPEALDQTILNELRHLINEKLVEISDVTRELPYYIALPQAKQDVEKARRLMIKDGFIPGN